MTLTHLCGVRLTAAACTDTLNLIACEADAYAGTTDSDASIHFTGSDHLTDTVAGNRIIEALRRIRADIDHLDALSLEIRLDLVLHLNRCMIVAND